MEMDIISTLKKHGLMGVNKAILYNIPSAG